MKRLALFFLLIVPIVSAFDVDVTLNANDIVAEKFLIRVPEEYDYFEFHSAYKPVSVIYEGKYLIAENEKSYMISFENTGKDIIEFTLLYDDIIESYRNRKIFRTYFENAEKISVTLPEKFILSNDPGAVPEPDEIITDGQKMTLLFSETQNLAVFYEGGQTYLNVIIFSFAVILCIGLFSFFYSRKKVRESITDTLSEDEKLIVEQVKKGFSKQKEAAKNLNFSKSKMSKVVRKLEEKGLIEKEPHFKTNKLKLKKIK
ncbi:MAG: winged helix DNA-binding protein [Nanoarchaeota archaeon]|nr:winged helix DNA-binding protein [Nanoarchaeota archaeon]